MIPRAVARALAQRDRRFDIFDMPRVASGAPAFRPLVLVAPDAGLVWGHRLLDGMDAEIDPVPALLVSPDTGEDRLLLLALDLEGRAGRYSWREVDRICAVAERTGMPDLVHRLDPERDLTVLVPRYRALPEALKTALDEELVDLRTAERTASLPEAVIMTLLDLSRQISFSRRRQMLVAVEEILRRDGPSGNRPAESLLESLDAVEPRDRFDLVMRLRYPRLTRMESLVESVRRETLGGTGVNLEPPARFEGERFRISFDIRSVDELRRRLAAIQKLEHRLDDLLEILFEDAHDDTLAP